MINLVERLKQEHTGKLHGGLYDTTQKLFAYNSNHIEGSVLTSKETAYIFETRMLPTSNRPIPVDDVIETVNHFKCFDFIIDTYQSKLTVDYFKQIHLLLKNGTEQEKVDITPVGDFKVVDNIVGNIATTPVERVEDDLLALLIGYQSKQIIDLKTLASFHEKFESIHPFADGNGRIGRLILFKECLKHSIVPFVVEENLKANYYEGLEKAQINGDLTGLIAFFEIEQQRYEALLVKLKILPEGKTQKESLDDKVTRARERLARRDDDDLSSRNQNKNQKR